MPSKVNKESQGHYGASIFEVYEADSIKRTIYALNDGGKWDFGQSGTPFPFERLDVYTAKRKQDRFTCELMKDYLKELGINAFEKKWYLPSNNPAAILVQINDQALDDAQEYSLEEALENWNGL